MGRAGITFDQVAAAANALEAERPGSATLKAVRDYLGTGSQTTVHQHLKTWRENRPKAALPAVEIPDEVRRTLTTWLMHASTLARAEAEDRVTNAEVTADELARAGELVERERDELSAQVADLTTQRDQAEATANARADEIARLQADIERERDLAGKAQVEAAQARLKVESQGEHLADMRSAAEKLTSDLNVQRTARTEAERLAAVSAAQLESARADLDAARAQVAALQQEVAASRDKVEKMRTEYQARSDEDRRALDHARGQMAAASVKQAELQADLRAAMVENEALRAKLKTAE